MSPYYSDKFPPPKRDLEKAKALLKAAGVEHPVINVRYPTGSRAQKVMEVVQAMAAEAGFDIKLVSTEFATQMKLQTDGDYEVVYIGWSGRPDPDGNIYSFYVCGGGLNDNHYCKPEVDKILADTRLTTDVAARKALYEQIRRHRARRPADHLPLFREMDLGHAEEAHGLRSLSGRHDPPRGREARAVRQRARSARRPRRPP